MSKAAGFRGKIERKQIPQLCGGCHSDGAFMRKYNPSLHTDQLSQYKTSVHGKLFANQRALAVDSLKGYAKDLGLDAGKFNACLDSGEKAKVVEANRKAGDEAGVSGTPAFFVNGLLISGAQPFESFKQLVDAELAKK